MKRKDLEFAEKLSGLLDTSFSIPGTRFRFGLDPLIGLVPFLGDVITLGMALVLIVIAIRNGAGSKLVVRMIGNVLVDTLGGSIPLIGTIFDFFYKSNSKNLDLLREHMLEGKHKGSARGILLGALLLVILLFIGIVYLVGVIISGFFSMFPEIYNWFMELFKGTHL